MPSDAQPTTKPPKLTTKRNVTKQFKVTRACQEPDVIYVQSTTSTVFVTPDGVGRVYYDSLSEAEAEHGELDIAFVMEIDE